MKPRLVMPPSRASTGGTSGTNASTSAARARAICQPRTGSNGAAFAPVVAYGQELISLDSGICIFVVQLTARQHLRIPVAHDLGVRIPAHALGMEPARLAHTFA